LFLDFLGLLGGTGGSQLGGRTAIMTPPKARLKLDDRLSPKPDIAKGDQPQASLVQEGGVRRVGIFK